MFVIDSKWLAYDFVHVSKVQHLDKYLFWYGSQVVLGKMIKQT